MKINKYHNKKSHCFLKHVHDSRFEADYCNRLLAMQKNGEIAEFEIQKTFDLTVNGILICRHIIDFLIVQLDLKLVAHEIKGFKTKEWIIKRKLFQSLYSNIPYVVISRRS